MKVEDNPIHSMILQNDAEGVKALLNDSTIDFKIKNERGKIRLELNKSVSPNFERDECTDGRTPPVVEILTQTFIFLF